MPDLDLPDITLHYEEAGEGPAMLLLPGMLSDSASWGPIVPLLSPHFRLIMPDNRATGRTVPWDAPITLDKMADDIRALMDALGLQQAHLLGHSMGGFMALRLCQIMPQRVISASIAASAPVALARSIAVFRHLLNIRKDSAQPERWLHILYAQLFHPATFDNPQALAAMTQASIDYPFAQSADAMAHQVEALATMDPSDFMKPSIVPCQAILAELDVPMPLPMARDVLAPLMDVHVIAGTGHAIHWEAPQAVADHVIQFAQTHEGAR